MSHKYALKTNQNSRFPGRGIFIGEVIETYVNQERITYGKLDFKKINPLLFTSANAKYWELGNIIGSAYKEGKTLIIPMKFY